MNFVTMFLDDDSVRGNESTLISDHRSMIFVSGCRSVAARSTHSIPPRVPFVPVTDRASTLWLLLGPDLRCARKYTVHHPSVILRAEYAC